MAHKTVQPKPLTRQEINRRLGLLFDLALRAAERADRERAAQQAEDQNPMKPSAASEG